MNRNTIIFMNVLVPGVPLCDSVRKPSRTGVAMLKKLLGSVYLVSFSPGRPWPPEKVESVRSDITRYVVTRLATDDTRLQRGEYTTQDDLDQELEQVTGLSF